MLAVLLARNRNAILSRWLDLEMAAYPEESRAFLRGEKDRFLNPVGHITAEGLASTFDRVLTPAGGAGPGPALEDMLKLKAVQAVSPAEALSFVFRLKQAVREIVLNGQGEPVSLTEWCDLESRIDSLALAAFDLYMQCRERIHAMRTPCLRT